MAFDVSGIRVALQTAIGVVDGLRVYPTIPDKPEFPAAIVNPAPDFIDYDLAMQKGLTEAKWEIVLLTPLSAGLDRAQNVIDGMLSAGTGQSKSIRDAIDADKTLGGVVNYARVSTVTQYGTVQPEGQPACATARLNVVTGTPRS